MSRTTVFIILGTIMLILAAMAAFKLDQEFSITKKKEPLFTTNGKQDKNPSNNLEKNPFIPPKSEIIESITSKNSFTTSSEDVQKTEPKNTIQQTQPFTDEIFVWITDAPKTIKPNEKAINQVRLTIEKKELSFRMVASEAIKTRTMLLQNPERLVIDIHGNWVASLPPIPSGNPWLDKIRVGYNDGYTRFVLELKKTPNTTETTQPKKNIIDVQIQ